MRYISSHELRESCYGHPYWVLSKFFNHPVIEDNNGVWRWKLNKLVKIIADSVSLNGLALKWHKNEFSLEEFMKFNMDIGYSLSGFGEIFESREFKGKNLIELVTENWVKYDTDSWMKQETIWH